jgi:hypothetical protein
MIVNVLVSRLKKDFIVTFWYKLFYKKLKKLRAIYKSLLTIYYLCAFLKTGKNDITSHINIAHPKSGSGIIRFSDRKN